MCLAAGASACLQEQVIAGYWRVGLEGRVKDRDPREKQEGLGKLCGAAKAAGPGV